MIVELLTVAITYFIPVVGLFGVSLQVCYSFNRKIGLMHHTSGSLDNDVSGQGGLG